MASLDSALSDIAGIHSQPVSREIPAPPTEVLHCTGRVKWFNDQKGFGFICDEDGRDIFVHYGVIDGGGFKTLKEGETVRYAYIDGPKGRSATKVVRNS